MKTRISTTTILFLLLLTFVHNSVSDHSPINRAKLVSSVLPARAPDGAVMIGWHEQGDDLAALRAHEQALGKRFAIVRLYQQWNLPGRKVDELVADGRLVLVSHKPPAPADGGWGAVASGREDATIRALADKYRGYGRQIIFSFHHEPHDDASDVKTGGRYGTSAQYKAAWRRIHDIFAEEHAAASVGGNV